MIMMWVHSRWWGRKEAGEEKIRNSRDRAGISTGSEVKAGTGIGLGY